MCAGASPGCVGVHHRDARRRSQHGCRWRTPLRPILTSPCCGDLRVDGSGVFRTRVPIAILSGVVHITPAKVLLSFSRVHSRLSHRDEGCGRHDFKYEFRGPPLHLGPRLGLGRWRRGPGKAQSLFMRCCAGSSRLGIETPEGSDWSVEPAVLVMELSIGDRYS